MSADEMKSEPLEWYPADFVDEACPPSKDRPEAFAFFDGERWQLGYATDEDMLEEDRETCNRAIAVGDVVEFMTCERFGDIEATVKRDGAMTFHGAVPPTYNVVVVNGDSDLLYPALEDLVDDIKNPVAFCNPAEMIFEDGADSARVTLSFAQWSDPLPHLFEIENGKPTFRAVPAQKN